MAAPIPKDSRWRGPFYPMRFEATIDDCIVAEGEVPKDLAGAFYRSGPSWRRPTKQGTLAQMTGDGMVQALFFRDGQVDFRNRWIRTPKFVAEERAGRALFEWTDCNFGDWRDWALCADVVRDEDNAGVPQGTSWVNVFPFAGGMLTSGEQGAPPIAIDPMTLDTIGVVPWSGKLSRGVPEPASPEDASFTGHPKWDAGTGELYGWAYRDEPPFLTLHRIRPDGTVQSRELWDAPYAGVVHDIWLSERYAVIPYQPWIVDRRRLADGLGIFDWKPGELPIVLALVPRDDLENGAIRWITLDAAPRYMMHSMSTNHVGDLLHLDAPVFENDHPFTFTPEIKPPQTAVLSRWTIDLATGKTTTECLDDEATEAPKLDERYHGRNNKWAFRLKGPHMLYHDTVVVRNVHAGSEVSYRIGSPQLSSVLEPQLAPRHPDAPEGDGYLIVPVSRWKEHRADYLIFDTDDVTAGPIARIELPFGIGWSFHGHWKDFRD